MLLMDHPRLIHFDGFQFDPDSGDLCRGDKCLPLLPKDSAVLSYLILSAGKIVSKKDLLEQVWKGVSVSDGVIKTCVKRLRQQLDDDSKNPLYIETVHRRGYRFIGRTEVDTSGREPSFPSGISLEEIVGRESELAVLHKAYECVTGGSSRYMFVTGEAGIGKSALVDQFEKSALLYEHSLVARGHCVDTLGPGEAYAPLFEALEMMADQVGTNRFGELMRRFAPMWLPHMTRLLEPGEAEVLAARSIGATAHRMLRELVILLGAIAQETTIVLIIEDAHWADGATIDALMILMNRLTTHNVMVVVTYRPEMAMNRGLKKLQLEMMRHDHCVRIPLLPLTEDDIDLYLSLGFAGRARPMMLAAWLMRFTEGNPLFVKALLDHAKEQGWLKIEAQVTWKEPVSRDITWSVPTSLRELIRYQFDRMPPRFRECLQIASVVGLSFPTRVMCGEAIADETALDELLNDLAGDYHFILFEGTVTWPDGTQSPRYTFVHAWYRQVVYDQISLLRRRELHRFIGERLENVYGDRCFHIAAVLAIHFELAHDISKAIQYQRLAGEAALQRHAYQDVQGHMERGLALIAQIPDDSIRAQQEIAFRILLGTTLSITNGYSAQEVIDNYARARMLCGQTQGDAYRMPVLYGLWGYHCVRAEFNVAADFTRRFEMAANREGAELDRAYAQFMAALNDFYQGRFRSARENADQCLSYSEPEDVNKIMQIYGLDSWSGSLTHRGLANWCLGYPEQGFADVERSVAFAEALDLPTPLASALACKIGLHLLTGDVDIAAGLVDRLVDLTEVHGVEYWKFHGAVYTGYIEAIKGDRDTGIRKLKAALDLVDKSGAKLTQTFFIFLFIDAYARVGDFQGGLNRLDDLQEEVETNAACWLAAEFFRLKGDLLLAVSQTDGRTPKMLGKVEANYITALDTAKHQKSKTFELRAAISLCRLRMQQGRPDDAVVILNKAYDWFDEGFGTHDLIEARSWREKLQ